MDVGAIPTPNPLLAPPARTRTYVAQLQTGALPSLATIGEVDRPTRKVLASTTATVASNRAARGVQPQLDALRGAGLVVGTELLPRTGTVLITVPDDRAAAAWQAVRGVDGLGRIVRSRPLASEPDVPGAPAPPPPPPGNPRASLVPAPAAPANPTLGYQVTAVHAPEAWALGARGAGVVVGIVDTGVAVTHPSLALRYRGTRADGTQVHDHNYMDAVHGHVAPEDDMGHGTHVAGITLGGTPGRSVGIAPQSRFIAARVFARNAPGSTATLLRGLEWMLAPTDTHGLHPDASLAPDIVNNSWSTKDDRTLDYLGAFNAFERAGIVAVAAAGNNGPGTRSLGMPGAYPTVLSVAAVDRLGATPKFSSRGPGPVFGPPKPDVAAPGVDVVSAFPGNTYEPDSGTSMAAPVVTGIAALLLSRYPKLTPAQVRTAIVDSAVDIGAPGWDPLTGRGRVDAVRALNRAAQLLGPFAGGQSSSAA